MVWAFLKTIFPLSIAIKKATNPVAFFIFITIGAKRETFFVSESFLKK